MNKIRTVFFASALALISTAGHAATVVLQNHSSSISVGDEFLVDVILQDAFAGEFSGNLLLAFGFNLSYDNTALELTSKSVGSLWDDDTGYFNFDLVGSVFEGIGDDGSNASILLGQLSFNALSAGFFSLGVSGSQADDPSLGLIYTDNEADILASLPVDVQPVQAVPIPAAGWLLFSGLAGLFGLRRRR